MTNFFKHILMGFATVGERFYTIANSFNPDNSIKSYDDVKKRYTKIQQKYKKLRNSIK
jgi:hypothetical protein